MHSQSCSRSVSIRPFRTSDVSHLYAAARESMEQLRGWMTWCDEDYSLEDSSNFILKAAEAWEQGTAYSFAIIGSQEDDFLGSVGLSHVNRAHNFANMGYWVRQSRTRSGVASAATLLAARFGLQELGLNRLELLIPTENMASQRVA